MKTHLIFISLLIIGFIGTAQNSTFKTFEEAIAIKPNITLIDLSDKSLSLIENTPRFNAFKYSKHIKNQLEGFDMTISVTETTRDGFLVFSPEKLKKNFFQDFNITCRRSELERLLPRSLDPNYYTPCIPGD